MEYGILGPLQVLRDTRPVELAASKERALLARLLVDAGRVVSLDRLIEDLWEESPPETANVSLRVHVSRLRKALVRADVIVTEHPGYRLVLGSDDTLDAHLFASGLARGRGERERGDIAAAAEALAHALSLWRGPVLAGIDAGFARSAAVRLEEERLAAIEERVEADLALGRHTEVVAELESLTEAHPLRERLWQHRMLALYRSGRQADALRCYRQVRDALVAELGIEPSRELVELERRILAHDPSIGAPAERRIEAPQITAGAHNLTAPPTSFIGRETARDEIEKLVAVTRLLTLTGPGGAGKTRLALQVAGDLVGTHTGGVWNVELAALTDPALVPHAIASALGVREQPGRTVIASVAERIGPEPCLLILDNCEHLSDACAEVAQVLLRACTGLRILATSRERLGVAGESIWLVPPMETPDPERAEPLEAISAYESVRLFCDRAQLTKPQFRLSSRNVVHVARLCHRLDGIPLAIELAAARVRVLTPQEIVERLDDRFRLLAGRSRDRTPRHATMRAAIDWSHDLLTEHEKILFRRLSVFLGGFTLEAAEEVCGEGIDVLDALSSLVEQSLVIADERDDRTRFTLLETVRAYAEERLVHAGETDRMRDRHLDLFVGFAERVRPRLDSPDQARWLREVEREDGNISRALEAPGASDGRGLRLVGAIWWAWHVLGRFSEGRRRLGAALASPAGDLLSRSRALNGAGALARSQGDLDAGGALHEDALAICREIGDANGIAVALDGLGGIARIHGDLPSARRRYEEALAIRREIDYREGIANSLSNLGAVVHVQGDYAFARTLYEESLALNREIGFQRGIALALNSLGHLARIRGDTAAALAHQEEAVTVFRRLGDPHGIAHSLTYLGDLARDRRDLIAARAAHEEALAINREIGAAQAVAYSLINVASVACDEGDPHAAQALAQESLPIFRELGDKEGMAYALEVLASTSVVAGSPERAVTLAGAADALRDEIGAPIPEPERTAHVRTLDQARASLGEEVFAEAFTSGKALRADAAIALALAADGVAPPA